MHSTSVYAVCGTISIVAICAALAARAPEVRVIRVVAPVPAPVQAPLLPRTPAPRLPHPTSSGVLLKDGFDAENDGVPVLMYDRFQNWRVKGGTVDLIGVGSDWDFQPGNGLYVDLDGDRPDGVHFESGALVSRDAFILSPGVYELSYRLAGSQRGDVNRMDVSLGDLFHTRVTLASPAPFRAFHHSIRVERVRSARLRFENQGADGYGLLLDDVILARRGATP